MPSPSDFNRRAANQEAAESSGATPVPMTSSGFAKMMEAIKQQASEVHGALERNNGYPLFAVTGASGMLVGAAGIGGVAGAAIGGLPALAVAGAAAAVVGMGALVKMMRGNQESTMTAITEARENARHRLQQVDSEAYSPKPN